MKSEIVQLSRRVVLVNAATMACGLTNRKAIAEPDPIPSWNDGATKKSITDFVARVTTQGGADFVPPAERIAVIAFKDARALSLATQAAARARGG
ncbi:hypothetical protein [Bradyrhizobium sp. 1(2017)]|uniref:hypothetical protein n=1 Tax=Bradyrhizobium sp. 1(2017) TaxID=1404888 RepID=UPI0039C8AAD5